jgi:alpha-beta hydrolase superfamily lysophospholipase
VRPTTQPAGTTQVGTDHDPAWMCFDELSWTTPGSRGDRGGVTTTALPQTLTSWDEPDGVAPRGSVIVLSGRGETAAAYGRLGRRISADAYKVRVVEVDLDEPDRTRQRVEELLADPSLPAPRVLLGTDTGATLAATLLERLPVDAAVLAGLVLASSSRPAGSWDDELEARTACPAHRRVISEDGDFERGALSQPLPEEWPELSTPQKPVLVLHGSLDPVTDAQAAFAAYLDAPVAELRLVEGGRHDVLNDVMHRSVAATIVLFLERLKLGADLPAIVRPAGPSR